jgi:hypothetical protein
VCFLILIALGIFINFYISKPNTRWFIKDNAKFWGNLNLKGDRIYTVMEVGEPTNFYSNEQMKFSLICDENHNINSANIDVNNLKSIADRIVNPNQYDKIWPDNSELIYFKSCSFIINENKVLNIQVEVRDSSVFTPAIGDSYEKKFFTFPLSEEQIIELFGKPDMTKDFFRH